MVSLLCWILSLTSTPFVTGHATVAGITVGVPEGAGILAVVFVLAVAGVPAVIGVPTVLFCVVFTSLPPSLFGSYL
jgi:hypothetical protein